MTRPVRLNSRPAKTGKNHSDWPNCGRRHERLADAHRPVVVRVLDRVAGLVRGHAERRERGRLAHSAD